MLTLRKKEFKFSMGYRDFRYLIQHTERVYSLCKPIIAELGRTAFQQVKLNLRKI